MKKKIDILDIGLEDYKQSLQRQYKLHEQVKNSKSNSTIIFTEHYPVLTLGKNSNTKNILWSSERLKSNNLQIVSLDRGGEVTAHERGQLVVYFILDLKKLQINSWEMVLMIQNAVIKTLQNFEIAAQTDAEYPGIWVDDKKICALGLRVKNHVSYHGLSLNINNNLRTFTSIIPCGIKGKDVCSVKSILKDSAVVYEDVKLKLWENLTEEFIN